MADSLGTGPLLSPNSSFTSAHKENIQTIQKEPTWYLRAYVRALGRDVRNSSVWAYMSSVTHHGSSPRSMHCEDVAVEALTLAMMLHINVSERELVRAALLHDGFRYDWKVKSERARFHAFVHGRLAVCEAEKEFRLTKKERNCITAHMFPAALTVPVSKEAWLISVADKICCAREYKRACGCSSFLKAFVKVRFAKKYN